MQQRALLRAIASGCSGLSASVLGTSRKLSLIHGSVGRSAGNLHSRCLLGVLGVHSESQRGINYYLLFLLDC